MIVHGRFQANFNEDKFTLYVITKGQKNNRNDKYYMVKGQKFSTFFILKNPFLFFVNSAANTAPIANPFRL